MARLIEQTIKRPLAEAILFGELKSGGDALIELKDDKPAVRLQQPSLAPA